MAPHPPTTTPTSLEASPTPRPTPWRSLSPAVRGLLLGECLGLWSTASVQMTVTWWIGHQGGAADLARFAACMGAAALVLTPLLSPAGDRWPKRRVIRWGRLLLVADALTVGTLCWSGTYAPGLLCLGGVVAAGATALLAPAEASLLAELVTPQGLPAAIRWRRAAQALGGFAGPGLGGLVIAGLGLDAAMAVNLALVAVTAGVACWRARTGPAPQTARPSAGTRRGWAAWWGDLADGLRAKWQVRLDRGWTLVGALMMLSLLPATGLLLPLRVQSLGGSAAWFGGCSAALSLGVLVGVAGLAPRLIERVGRVRALTLAILTCSAAMAGVGLCEAAGGLVVLFALIGLCLSVTQLVGQTHRLLAMPAAYRSRMTAAQLTVTHAVAALAPPIAGGLLQQASVATVYLVLSATFAASGLLLLRVPGLGAFLRQDHRSVEGWYERHWSHAFRLR